MKKKILAGLTVVVMMFGMAGVMEAALIHQYDFTSGVNDSIGGAHGVMYNGAVVSGGVLTLDGINDYVQFSSHIVPTSGSYTVALFAQQVAAQSGYSEMISQGFSGGPGFYIGESSGGTVRVSDSWTVTSVTFPSDLAQHHFAVTVDSSAGKSSLYIDGLLAAFTNSAITTTLSGSDTRLGRQFGDLSEYFNGTIDDVRIYNTALSAAEIANLAAPVPEPATMLLMGTGLAVLAGVRRKK